MLAEPRGGPARLLLLNPFFNMATSPIFGAFGPLRKSIGSVTFSTLATSRDGKRKQVARQKPTSVRNPNTVAQILQRMKLAPAQRFYEAFEKVVAKGIMSHSWEGVSYGNASRQEFMSRAMKNDAAIYVPKGYNAFAPGEYEVSAGSLPSFNWRNDLGTGETPEADALLDVNTALTDAVVQKLLGFGYQLGDQITIIGATENNGLYNPFAMRLIIGVGNRFEMSGAVPGELYITTNGINYDENSKLAAVAVIVSRGQDMNAKRSSSQMLLLGKYKNLISPEAMNAAIASYESGEAVTSLGSDWYLNNTPLTGQAVAGTVKTLSFAAIRESGEPTEITKPWLVVERVSNGQIGYLVGATEGGNEANAFSVNDSNDAQTTPWSSAEGAPEVSALEVSRGLIAAGYNYLGKVIVTKEVAAQGGFGYDL